MEFDGPSLEWVPYLPGRTTKVYPMLNQNVLLGTGTYCMPEQEYDIADPIEIGLGLVYTQQEKKVGVGVPVHPTESLVAAR